MASFTTGSDGRIVASSSGPLSVPATSQVKGSPVEAAAAKTMASQQLQAEAAKAMGAGQKAGSRKRRKRRGGAQNMNVVPSNIPTANTVPGHSPTDVNIKLTDALNAMKTGAVYDKLASAPARQVAGFRMRDAESLYPGTGTQVDTKRSRKTKKRHGLRKHRSHRRRTHRVSRRRSRRHHRK